MLEGEGVEPGGDHFAFFAEEAVFFDGGGEGGGLVETAAAGHDGEDDGGFALVPAVLGKGDEGFDGSGEVGLFVAGEGDEHADDGI